MSTVERNFKTSFCSLGRMLSLKSVFAESGVDQHQTYLTGVREERDSSMLSTLYLIFHFWHHLQRPTLLRLYYSSRLLHLRDEIMAASYEHFVHVKITFDTFRQNLVRSFSFPDVHASDFFLNLNDRRPTSNGTHVGHRFNS